MTGQVTSLVGYEATTCLCHTITMAFQLTITRMGEMGLVKRMADKVVLETRSPDMFR